MNIQTIYDYAKLATFSYVDLSASSNPENIEEIIKVAASKDNPGATERIPIALGRQMFDPTKDTEITGRWTLLDPYYRHSPETGHSDPASGFSAMLLENTTYGKVLAIAGTEPGGPGQVLADLVEADVREIGFWGVAFRQVVSLFNYVQELQAPEGQATQRLTLHEGSIPGSPDAVWLPLPGPGPDAVDLGTWLWLESDMSGSGRGLIQPGEVLTVTGHSLGGHLSALAIALFPDLFSEAFTFNAPGFDPDSSRINFPLGGADQLLDMLRPYGAQPLPVNSIAPRVNTLEAEDVISGDDWEVVAGNVTGQPFSSEHYIATENVSHDVGHMLDSLAVQALMARLNPSLSDQDTGAMLDAMSGSPDAVLETVVEQLHFQLIGSAITLESTTAGLVDGGGFAIRSQLFDGLLALQNQLPQWPQARLHSLVSIPLDTLKVLAEDGGADGLFYRYALEQLNPFAVTGGQLSSDATNRLALYDRETGSGQITPEWIAARAELLNRQIQAAIADSNAAQDPFTQFGGGEADSLAVAYASDERGGRLFGGAGNDTLTGLSGKDYLEGGDDHDALKGNAGADSLRGMDGDDLLNGGEGNDWLEGGLGSDTYVFRTGDGFDRILDAGGQGSLEINDTLYAHAKQVAPHSNVWLSEDGLVRFTLSAASTGAQILIVEYGNHDRILIQNFKPGDLGLTLSDYQQNSPVVVPLESPAAIDEDDSEPGVQYGLNGSDSVTDDRLEGGLGDDDIHSGYGQDTVVGGAGSDRLWGNEDDDQLFAEQPLALSLAAQPSDSTAGGVRGDWLDGWHGNDTLVGARHDDALHGGSGQDLLIGGDGNDNLTGDGASYLVGKDWQEVRKTQVLAGNLVSFTSYFTNAEVRPVAVGGDDVLLGGAGNDWLVGDGGNDLLDGGTGMDVAFGDSGDDTLLGGADNDVLSGDNLDWEGGGLPSALHGHDLLDGGDGDDLLTGNGGHDILLGGAGNDFIKGDDSSLAGQFDDAYRYHGNDYLQGDSGNDTLSGGGGADSLYGGADNDLLEGDYADLPVEYQGDDSLDGGTGNDTLIGTGGDDQLVGGTGDDSLDGDKYGMDPAKQGDDLLHGDAGNDSLWGGGGADTLNGGADNDYLEGDYNDLQELYQGADYLDGGLGRDTLVGDGGNDTLLGGGGEDYLVGGGGNNLLDGGSDNDVLEAGSGNDRYVFASGYGLDTIRDEGGENRIQFGAGFSQDTLRADVIQVDSTETVLRLFNGTGDALLIFDYQGWSRSIFSFADGGTLTFTELMRKCETPITGTGTAQADSLFGTNLADRLDGNEGDDQLRGQGGADTLAGGLGNDSYLFNIGDGADVIRDGDGVNVVRFGEGISQQSLSCQVTYMLSGAHALRFEYEGGSVAIVGGASGAVSRFEFADGSTLSLEQMLLGATGFNLTSEDVDSLVYGSGSADTLSGGRGNDSINAQSGDDLVRGGAGNDWLQGADGHDRLYGDIGDDYLLGGLGDDTLIGGSGNDTLEGGAGHNSYVFRLGMQRDVLLAQEGSANTLQIDPMLNIRDLFSRRVGDDLFIEYRYADDGVLIQDFYKNPQLWRVQSNAGAEQSMQDFLSTLTNSIEPDANFYERQFQRQILEGFAWDAIRDHYQQGDDGRFYHISTANYQYIFKERTSIRSVVFSVGEVESNPAWVGEAGQSVLLSRAYESSFESRRELIEVARLYGGSSDMAASGQPIFYRAGEGGFKFDHNAMVTEVKDAGGNTTGWFVYPPEQGQSDGLGWNQYKTFEWTTNNYTEVHKIVRGSDGGGLTNIELGNIFYAGGGNDALIAKQGPQTPRNYDRTLGVMLSGGAGDDTLVGNDGNDFLLGGVGDDFLFGSNGKDTYIAVAGNGNDVVADFLMPYPVGDSPGDWEYRNNPSDSEDTLVLPENIALSQLSMRWGNVVLEGIHLDKLSSGNGQYLYDASSREKPPMARMLYASLDISWGTGQRIQVIMPHANEPVDTGIELFRFADGTALTRSELLAYAGLGSVPDPYLLGGLVVDDGANDSLTGIRPSLAGGAGNDTLIGSGELWGWRGEDLLRGGAAADVLYGGNGSDTLYGGNGNDTLIGGANNYFIPNGDDDNDLLDGGAGDDLLKGGNGNDTLNGGLDTDTLYGGMGDDVYVVDEPGDLIIESASEGTDRVYSSLSWVLGEHLENLTLTGSAAINGSGNELNNYLLGNAANNLLQGGIGNDILNGGLGVDTLHGGIGDDVFVVDNPGDVIIEHAGEGIDKVNSSVSWVLSEHLERLVLTGSDAIDGTGNELNNLLHGNAANNQLWGGAGNDVFNGGLGADTLHGGSGDDVFVADNAGDVIIEYAGEGIDRINSSINWTLGESLENLILTGNADINGTGNELNNSLHGNAANNVLWGGAGNDTLRGGAGNDTYLFGRGGGVDRIMENDLTPGNSDLALFGDDISQEQLWFRRSNSHLEVSIIGSSDKLIVHNWYLDEQYRVESFKTADGKTLLDGQVQNLVDAMASFGVPAGGESSLTADQRAQLDVVIAANWK